jgi:hypothetical protein
MNYLNIFLSDLLNDLSDYILKDSGLCNEDSAMPSSFRFNGNDLLFSRGHWKGERYYQAKLLRQDAAEGVEWAAAQLGIDPKQVSTRSWRKGAITSLVVHGQSDEVVRRFGDNVVGSASTFLYQHETGQEVRPLLFASREGGLSVGDIQRVSRISAVEFSQIEAGQSFLPLVDIQEDDRFELVEGEVEESEQESDSDSLDSVDRS